MEWRLLSEFPDYEVSEGGSLRRVTVGRGARRGHVLRPWRRADGYAMYIIRKDGRSIHKKAHQLVALAFLGEKPFDAAEVCHNDGDPSNDHWSNLRWDTRASNHADKILHGTSSRGERHGQSKISDKQAQEIREKYADGVLQRVLAAEYGIQQGHISRIVNGVRRSY